MSILLAMSEWDEAAWRARLGETLPHHPVATPAEGFDRAAIRYALCWRHPPGSLAGLPNLRTSRANRRSCASSIRTCATA